MKKTATARIHNLYVPGPTTYESLIPFFLETEFRRGDVIRIFTDMFYAPLFVIGCNYMVYDGLQIAFNPKVRKLAEGGIWFKSDVRKQNSLDLLKEIKKKFGISVEIMPLIRGGERGKA